MASDALAKSAAGARTRLLAALRQRERGGGAGQGVKEAGELVHENQALRLHFRQVPPQRFPLGAWQPVRLFLANEFGLFNRAGFPAADPGGALVLRVSLMAGGEGCSSASRDDTLAVEVRQAETGGGVEPASDSMQRRVRELFSVHAALLEDSAAKVAESAETEVVAPAASTAPPSYATSTTVQMPASGKSAFEFRVVRAGTGDSNAPSGSSDARGVNGEDLLTAALCIAVDPSTLLRPVMPIASVPFQVAQGGPGGDGAVQEFQVGELGVQSCRFFEVAAAASAAASAASAASDAEVGQSADAAATAAIRVLVGESPGQLGIGGKVWDASLVLLEYLSAAIVYEGDQAAAAATAGELQDPSEEWPRLRQLLRRGTCLELGSGTGMVGICLSLMGACDVTVTDLEEVVPLMDMNIRLNMDLAVTRSAGSAEQPPRLVAAELAWGDDAHAAALPGPATEGLLIIMSDVVYEPCGYSPLVKTLRVLLAQPGSVAVLCHRHRHPDDHLFFDELRLHCTWQQVKWKSADRSTSQSQNEDVRVLHIRLNRETPAKVRATDFSGKDPWACSVNLVHADCSSDREDTDQVVGTVRPMRVGDEALLAAFGREGLSAASRGKFECYGWLSDGLTAELSAAIQASVARRDLHLLALDEVGTVVGYVFLWAASDDIPELGLAVADAWHGRWLGSALLRLMEQLGKAMGRQALELTTMQGNERALAVYRRAGWEHLGLIHNPLGVDVPAAFEGRATPTGIAVENHFALILDDGRRTETVQHLRDKQERALQLFPVPDGGLDATGIWRGPPPSQ
jgi:ribosomal protein S18 acetylase RimI-like enzyme/predicted nicotinamide N-methyase